MNKKKNYNNAVYQYVLLSVHNILLVHFCIQTEFNTWKLTDIKLITVQVSVIKKSIQKYNNYF